MEARIQVCLEHETIHNSWALTSFFNPIFSNKDALKPQDASNWNYYKLLTEKGCLNVLAGSECRCERVCFCMFYTQMCEGFFVPGPSGDSRQVFIRRIAKENIQVSWTIQLENVFQLLHIQIGSIHVWIWERDKQNFTLNHMTEEVLISPESFTYIDL